MVKNKGFKMCPKCNQPIINKEYFEKVHNKSFICALEQLSFWERLKSHHQAGDNRVKQ